MESHVWSSVTGFFHLAEFFVVYLCCRVCQHFSPFHSQVIFHWMDICTTFCVFIHHLWTFGSFPPYVHSAAVNTHVHVFCIDGIPCRLGIQLRVELLGHVVTVIVWGPARLFDKAVPQFTFQKQCACVPIPPRPCQHFLFPNCQIMAILVTMKWHLVALICVFLWWLIRSILSHVFFVHLCIFLGEMPTRAFAHSLIRLSFYYWGVGVFYRV